MTGSTSSTIFLHSGVGDQMLKPSSCCQLHQLSCKQLASFMNCLTCNKVLTKSYTTNTHMARCVWNQTLLRLQRLNARKHIFSGMIHWMLGMQHVSKIMKSRLDSKSEVGGIAVGKGIGVFSSYTVTKWKIVKLPKDFFFFLNFAVIVVLAFCCWVCKVFSFVFIV